MDLHVLVYNISTSYYGNPAMHALIHIDQLCARARGNGVRLVALARRRPLAGPRRN